MGPGDWMLQFSRLGGLDAAVLQAWRLGDLEAWLRGLEPWRLGLKGLEGLGNSDCNTRPMAYIAYGLYRPMAYIGRPMAYIGL